MCETLSLPFSSSNLELITLIPSKYPQQMPVGEFMPSACQTDQKKANRVKVASQYLEGKKSQQY